MLLNFYLKVKLVLDSTKKIFVAVFWTQIRHDAIVFNLKVKDKTRLCDFLPLEDQRCMAAKRTDYFNIFVKIRTCFFSPAFK